MHIYVFHVVYIKIGKLNIGQVPCVAILKQIHKMYLMKAFLFLLFLRQRTYYKYPVPSTSSVIAGDYFCIYVRKAVIGIEVNVRVCSLHVDSL